MAERWTRRALHQAIGTAIVAALVVAAIAYLASRPQGPGSLKAEVSALRSQAAESALMLDARARLYRRFYDAHVDQLSEDVTRTRSRIAGLHLRAELQASQRFALDAAARIETALHESADANARSAVGVLKSELERLEQSLER